MPTDQRTVLAEGANIIALPSYPDIRIDIGPLAGGNTVISRIGGTYFNEDLLVRFQFSRFWLIDGNTDIPVADDFFGWGVNPSCFLGFGYARPEILDNADPCSLVDMRDAFGVDARVGVIGTDKRCVIARYRREDEVGNILIPDVFITLGVDASQVVAFTRIMDDLLPHDYTEAIQCSTLSSVVCAGCGGTFENGESRTRTVPDASCPSGAGSHVERCECNAIIEVSHTCIDPAICSGCGGVTSGTIRNRIRTVDASTCPSKLQEFQEQCLCNGWQEVTGSSRCSGTSPAGTSSNTGILFGVGGVALAGLIVFLVAKTRKDKRKK